MVNCSIAAGRIINGMRGGAIRELVDILGDTGSDTIRVYPSVDACSAMVTRSIQIFDVLNTSSNTPDRVDTVGITSQGRVTSRITNSPHILHITCG